MVRPRRCGALETSNRIVEPRMQLAQSEVEGSGEQRHKTLPHSRDRGAARRTGASAAPLNRAGTLQKVSSLSFCNLSGTVYSNGLEESKYFMRSRSPFWAAILFVAVLSTTGCSVFSRTRPVEDQYSKTPLKSSSQQGLIDSINEQAEAIRSLKATVDIDSSVGGIKKGHVTDYKEIRGYVLARKPGALHMIGLLPIVRTTAFDMVSDGQEFKLWMPTKNRFVIGKNQVATPNTDQPMENIRPQNIYEALLIRRIDPESEIAVLENGYETLHDAKGR